MKKSLVLFWKASSSKNRIRKDDSILLLGHSLGATIAEAIQLKLKEKEYTCVSAYGFDSPGIPQYFRSRFPPLRNIANEIHPQAATELIIVYALDNIVKNLTLAPPGAICYRVGKDEPWSIENVKNFLLQKNLLLGFFRLFISSLRSHSLDSIIPLLEKGHFQEDTETAGHDSSAVALRFVFRAGAVIGNAMAVVQRIPATRTVPDVRSTSVPNLVADYRFPEFPGADEAGAELEAAAAFKRRRHIYTVTDPIPYKVPVVAGFASNLDPLKTLFVLLLG